jgi:endo-1,4-beta-xylanase
LEPDDADECGNREHDRRAERGGVKVNITELDVTVPPGAPGGAATSTAITPEARAAIDLYPSGLPDEMQQQLARRYADIFKIVLDHKSVMTRITFWASATATDG